MISTGPAGTSERTTASALDGPRQQPGFEPLLRRLFHRCELSIFADDADDRLRQEFGWGLERLDDLAPEGLDREAPEGAFRSLAAGLCEASDDFYRAAAPENVRFDGHRLSFESPLRAEHREVERASARLFESKRANGRAVVVIPQWNADGGSLVQACKILNAFGLTAVRLTLPYHEERRPEGMLRADPMVSPVVGMTLQSVRRAVIEVRLVVDWLCQQGYERIGMLGASLGSCVGFLALCHEPRIRCAAFNHVAAQFADVVWSGLATQHVRQSLDPHIDLETLRSCWAPISPASFVGKLRGSNPAILMVSGAYDPIFRPEHGRELAEALDGVGVSYRRIVFPCGHYTLGRFPFYLVDAWLVGRFLQRHLS